MAWRDREQADGAHDAAIAQLRFGRNDRVGDVVIDCLRVYVNPCR